jgi:hypothetical protein
MTELVGPVHAAAAVVVLAGAAKVRRPSAAGAALRTLGLPGSRPLVRLLAAGELAIGLAVLTGAGGGRAAVAVLAALHLAFAAVAAALRARSATCGCFGEAAPVTGTHVAVNAVVACVALLAAASGDLASFGAAIGATPVAGVPYLVLVATLAGAEVTMLTALAEAQTAAAALRAGARGV